MKNTIKTILVGLILILSLSIVSAMTVSSVDSNDFQPGSEQSITLKVKNTLNEQVEDVSLNLDLSKVPFIVTDSENDIDEIDEDDSETLDFTIKASNNAEAGDYEIPYTLNYILNNTSHTKEGTFSLTIEGNPELVYTALIDKPVVGEKAQITLKIVNKGFGDAKFTTVKITPNGYTLTSEDNVYIGTIDSDDFETITLDVILKSENPTLNAQIEYKDFDNQKITKNVNLPLTVYSREKAIELGIIQKDYTLYYSAGAVILFVVWIIRRQMKKKKRLERSQGR